MKTTILSLIAGVSMLYGGAALAGEPVLDVSPRIHPNLAAAQSLSRQAYNKITAAQKANGSDMGGHAQKAKDLLEQVNLELKLAAESANRNKGR